MPRSAKVTTTAERWWRVEEVARMLKCTKGTVWRMIARGRLRAAKLGRVYRISDSALRALDRR